MVVVIRDEISSRVSLCAAFIIALARYTAFLAEDLFLLVVVPIILNYLYRNNSNPHKYFIRAIILIADNIFDCTITYVDPYYNFGVYQKSTLFL